MNLVNFNIPQLIRNKKVLENYFFLTVLQFLNSFFYLLIYPFIIRHLGASNYGLYVFALSIASYCTAIVNFGFTNPGVREVSIHRNNKKKLSHILSCILTAQTYLFFATIIILTTLLISIPFLRANFSLYFICSISAVTSILFPSWFFQGIEQMKFITILQLGTKLLSLIFIFTLIQDNNDTLRLAFINTTSSIIGACIATYLIIKKWGIKLSIKPLNDIYQYFKDGLPFFWGSSASIIKMQSTSFFTGTFISMSSVAMYDLANKLVMIPTMILSNINNALFPKMAKIQDEFIAKKVIIILTILSLFCITMLGLFGKLIIKMLGGEQMIGAYPILLILCFIIPSWLIVGAIQFFILIPSKKYNCITISQVMAFSIYMLMTIVGSIIYKNIFWIAAAMSISALAELLYNLYLIKKRSIVYP